MSAAQPPGGERRGPSGTEAMAAFPEMTAPAAEAIREPPRAMVHPAAVAVPAAQTPPVADAKERLRGFRRHQIYEATAPAAALLEDLTHIQQVDARAEVQHRWLTRVAWLTTLPGVVALLGFVLPRLLAALDGGRLGDLLGQGIMVLTFVFWVPFVAYPYVRARIFPLIHQPTGDGAGTKALLAVASGILTFVLANALTGLRDPFGLAVGLVALGVLVQGLARQGRRYDTEDRRYLLAHALLETVGRDVAAMEALHLRVDLRPPNTKDKLIERTSQAVYNGKAQIGRFVDPWLTLDGRLLDGTRFALTLQEQVTIKNAIKGRKSKFKTKTKSKTRAALEFRLKPSRVRGLEAMARQGRGALQLERGVQVRRVTGSADRLFAEVGFAPGGGQPDIRDEAAQAWVASAHKACVQLFLGLYQVVQAAVALKKREAA